MHRVYALIIPHKVLVWSYRKVGSLSRIGQRVTILPSRSVAHYNIFADKFLGFDWFIPTVHQFEGGTRY